ncbi:hypothetical protein POTOM_006880 [Populus tomentosa]|uniref:Uncharacterized protein n=1 Tax=Populus tomentosa TaxID=118781 RepID=A0A8X8DF60_POPTO|nr:hypothetical protein POTOM_006880 [Populus tomentosa]
MKRETCKTKLRQDFVREHRHMKREYDEFKVQINALPYIIQRRSDVCNSEEESRCIRHYKESEKVSAPEHSRGDHASSFLDSTPESQFRIQLLDDLRDVKDRQANGYISSIPRQPADAARISEAIDAISCWNEDKTDDLEAWLYDVGSVVVGTCSVVNAPSNG